MNGLDFDHRVLQPWANNPAFYVTVFLDESDQPAREGPLAAGAVELWKYAFPLSAKDAAEIAAGLAIDARTARAGEDEPRRATEGSLDLRRRRHQGRRARTLTQLASRADGQRPAISRRDVDRAKAATDAFAAWLDSQASSQDGAVGHRRRQLQLVSEERPARAVHVAGRGHADGARARALVASLALEEQRNAKLPPQVPIASAEEHDTRFNAAVTEYMAFLKDHDILTIRPDMEPALRARIGRSQPGPREFFSEVDYRDPEVMRTHGYHWFDKGGWRTRRTRVRSARARCSTTSSTRAPRASRRLGRADAAGRDVRRAAALARAHLHPGRRARPPARSATSGCTATSSRSSRPPPSRPPTRRAAG